MDRLVGEGGWTVSGRVAGTTRDRIRIETSGAGGWLVWAATVAEREGTRDVALDGRIAIVLARVRTSR